jgi:ribosome-associated heat shock protein Hsp15
MADERQRLDKWLWFSRVVKTRSLAAKLAASGSVRINRNRVDTPSHPVKIGDVLTIGVGPRVLVRRVVALGERRGPPEEARTLYEDLSGDSEKDPTSPP